MSEENPPRAAAARTTGASARTRIVAVALSCGLVLSAIVALGTGPMHVSAADVLRTLVLEPLGLSTGAVSDQARVVLGSMRGPRVALAIVAGAALGISGGAVQGLFRNPLADPGLLGVSSGASLGAALAIVMFRPLGWGFSSVGRSLALPLAAFVGAACVTLVVARVGRVAHERGRSELLLAGIAINALVGAAVGLVSQLADDAQLRDLVFWTLGGLGRSSWTHVASALPWVVLCIVLILRRSAELDALALGPREASYLGVDVARTERALAVAITLGVGAAVAVTGLVGFVGLVVPHVARALVGPAHRAGLVVSALLGAWLLLVADTVARTIASPVELPVGLLTAMVGGPFFLGLVVRRSREA